MKEDLSDIGLFGLGVMGQNLALNIADHGYKVSLFNRTLEKAERFAAENPDTPGGLLVTHNLDAFARSLAKPRKIILMLKAGDPTDAAIDAVSLRLEEGDILIDGGNTHWLDTIRREGELRKRGLHFIGSGVSGGELGARFGPSLMPGGTPEAWEAIKPIWQAIAAKIDPETGREMLGATPGKPLQGGLPCTAHIGENGAGHYVKMVHNGIEYGDMQMICEAYDLMRRLLGMTPPEAGEVFARWNEGELNSFLIEITADILQQQDPVTGQPFVEVVLDRAGQKGTGKWTSTSALDLGSPAPTIAEAVFARCLSAIKDEREQASRLLKGPEKTFSGEREALIEAIRDALYCSKICSYAQGFQLMRLAQEEYDWALNFGEIAGIFRGGCIIRAAFLQRIMDAYERAPALPNLLLDAYFQGEAQSRQANWRRAVATAVEHGAPVPSFSSALSYYDGYRSACLPQNLLQAQRDYFGAHSYERTDQPRGQFFHLDWPEPGRPQAAV